MSSPPPAQQQQLSDEDAQTTRQFIEFLQKMKFDKTLAIFGDELKMTSSSSNTGGSSSSSNGTAEQPKLAKTSASPTQPPPQAATSSQVHNLQPQGTPASPKSGKKPTPPPQVKAAEGSIGDFSTLRTLDELCPHQRGPFDHWTYGETGIKTMDGDASDLWEIEDFQSQQSPSYSLGGGITVAEHGSAKKEEVEMVPSKPYQKETPKPGALESFDLRVIYEAGKTGFEHEKEFPIVIGSVIAGRYQVTEYVGSAAFSRAVQCVDLKYGHEVCIKIIRNGKDFFDQALDEVKLLQYINSAADPDEAHVLQLYDYFYHKEHVFLVCELLRDNLYEFAKYNREEESEFYFTLPRLRSIAKQVLTALAYIHSLNLVHCDLKPENILIKSYSRCEIKVIDFGSSCYTSDSLSSYIQSRCYRAPEVVLGCKYNGKIDVWSLGAILPELLTGHVLFHCDSVAGMLARISAVCGTFPSRMLHEGRHACRFVSKHGVFYEYEKDTDRLLFHYPRRSQLSKFLGSGAEDPLFADFISRCLTVDPAERPSAAELLQHPFLLATEEKK